MDQVSIILRILTTVIAVGILLYWYLDIREWDWGGLSLGGPLPPFIAFILAIIIVIIGIASIIAIWTIPLLAGIGFLFLGLSMSFCPLYYYPSIMQSKYLVFAIVHIICGALTLVVWQNENKKKTIC